MSEGGLHPESFKAAFRRLAAGVCVVMFRRHGRPHGFTATSVTPVSMAPPKLLFCVATGNDSHAHLTIGTRVGVSLLSAGQRPLSDRFAGKAAPGGYDDVPTFEGPGGGLLLPGALAGLEARVATLVPAGDHTIFVCDLDGAVLDGAAPSGATGGEAELPLLHFARTYHALAPLPAAPRPSAPPPQRGAREMAPG
jgi:flavin reductase (DIM6/NTAB) family NADH-FMN oxidoreductase RutF